VGRRTDETPILTQRRVRVVERVEVFRPIPWLSPMDLFPQTL